MMLVAAVPAIAQVNQETKQGVESGDSRQTFVISGSGASASDCAAILAAAQSGNRVNSTGTLQSNSDNNDVEIHDSGKLTISPELAEECEQKINQTATVTSSKAEAPKTAPAAKAQEEAATTQAKSETTQANTEAKAGEKTQLPKSGGIRGSLFALAAGALLLAGGLWAYRVIKDG